MQLRVRLVIDLSRVPFIDSAGLGALIGGIRRTRELGGQVAVACSRPDATGQPTGIRHLLEGCRNAVVRGPRSRLSHFYVGLGVALWTVML